MRAVAIVNQKGGSGKTTTTVNLAAALGERGRRVLILDLDPQASSSHWLRVEAEGRGILDLLTGDASLTDLAEETSAAGVHLVPASSWLIAADKVLADREDIETLLRDQLEALRNPPWDYLLLDCPPNLGTLTVNSLAAAREVLIPVETRILPLHGLAQLLETIEVVKERLNPDLAVTGILACRMDRRTRLATEVVKDLRDRFGKLVYKTAIRENVRLAECPSFGQSILEYDTRSAGAEDYRALARQVLAQERSH